MNSIEEIIQAGVRFWDVSEEDLRGLDRHEMTVLPRHSIMCACRFAGHSFQAIGTAFNRDHGTAIYAMRQMNPEKYRGKWETHQRLLVFIKAMKNENPLKGVADAISLHITQIDAKIFELTETKQKLINILATIHND